MTYRVQHGHYEAQSKTFETWPEALAFARKQKPWSPVSVYNDDKADQDSYGLTDEQFEELAR